MRPSDHAREIRERLNNPAELAESLGLRIGRRRQARGVYAACPVHADKHPSCSVRVGRDETIACRCHACGWTGDALGLVAAVRGLSVRHDFRAVLEAAADLAGYDIGRGCTKFPRRRRDPAVDLALRIDSLAEDWLAGLPIKPDAVIEGATAEQIGVAMETLAQADETQRESDAERDAEFERLADAWEEREREVDAAYRAAWEAQCP